MEVAYRVELKGLVLDIGGKGKPSYEEVLHKSDGATWIVMDYFPGQRVGFCGDLTSIPVHTGQGR